MSQHIVKKELQRTITQLQRVIENHNSWDCKCDFCNNGDFERVSEIEDSVIRIIKVIDDEYV